jgi:hypothetical protein
MVIYVARETKICIGPNRMDTSRKPTIVYTYSGVHNGPLGQVGDSAARSEAQKLCKPTTFPIILTDFRLQHGF